MKIVKILAILIGVYALIVVAFETGIGVLQPDLGNTIVISTVDEDGDSRDRVITRLEVGGRMYVSAHHWPRAWYRRAMANPEVEITREGERKPYRAARVTGDEYDRVAAAYPRPVIGAILQGFAPRRIVRLDPR